MMEQRAGRRKWTMMIENRVFTGDCGDILKTFPDNSVDCCVTSPPYFGLRDYGMQGQIGLEKTPDEYIGRLLAVFGEVRRVLKDVGTLWVVIGDSYNPGVNNAGNTHQKSLLGIPFRLALALIDEGWILRQDIIWHKTMPMPESVKDRFCRSHEYLFFLTKKKNYYFDYKNALEPANTGDGNQTAIYRSIQDGTAKLYWRCQKTPDGRTLRLKRDVWAIGQEQFHGKHYAVYPQKLIEPCILCGCPENGIVLDPFMGSGTTAVVAKKFGRKYTGVEINPEYVKIAERRIAEINPLFEGAV
jgi:site-specific DNA-methyltransferase (adenine-specific)